MSFEEVMHGKRWENTIDKKNFKKKKKKKNKNDK